MDKLTVTQEARDAAAALIDQMPVDYERFMSFATMNRIACQAFAQAIAEAEDRATRSRWQPIETAPKDGTACLVFDAFPSFELGVMRVRSYDLGAAKRGGNGWFVATHWQPLPEPPARGDEHGPA